MQIKLFSLINSFNLRTSLPKIRSYVFVEVLSKEYVLKLLQTANQLHVRHSED